MEGNKESATSNVYLELRKAKIARNEARLAELGLLRRATAPSTKSRTKNVISSSSPSLGGKDAKKPRPPVVTDVRRSARHTSRPTTYLVQDAPDLRRKRQKVHLSASSEETEKVVKKRGRVSEKSSNINPRSVRLIDLDVNEIVQGVLGRVMEFPGKSHVIEEAARRASNKDNVHGLSFNKYCGVQEWQNDAVFLWVNIGANGDVLNDFLDNGRQVRLCMSQIRIGVLNSNLTALMYSCFSNIKRSHGLVAAKCTRIRDRL